MARHFKILNNNFYCHTLELGSIAILIQEYEDGAYELEGKGTFDSQPIKQDVHKKDCEEIFLYIYDDEVDGGKFNLYEAEEVVVLDNYFMKNSIGYEFDGGLYINEKYVESDTVFSTVSCSNGDEYIPFLYDVSETKNLKEYEEIHNIILNDSINKL